MQIQLPYGKGHLTVTFPEDVPVSIIEPRYPAPLDDPLLALREGLRHPDKLPPLRSLVRQGDRVGIVINDVTRATPSRLMLQAILEELDQAEVTITLFVALGSHRPNTPDELEAMLGTDLLARFPVVQNDAFDRSTQTRVGKTPRGTPIWINKALLECDLRILTGFVEPHFFAGFSGGGKAIMPGMAGLETILANHAAPMIAHPNSTWGLTQGNPVWEDIHQAVDQINGNFLVNVTLNQAKAVTGVFCGDVRQAHARGCQFARNTAMIPVQELFDVVITSNSGYPLDMNLYQSVKGMSAAARIVKPGGAIIVAAECVDGIPQHGLFEQLLRNYPTPQALLNALETFGPVRQDQWQAQVLAQILTQAEVYLYTGGLTPGEVRSAMLRPCLDISAQVSELVKRNGKPARVAVLTDGPQTIPYLQSSIPAPVTS